MKKVSAFFADKMTPKDFSNRPEINQHSGYGFGVLSPFDGGYIFSVTFWGGDNRNIAYCSIYKIDFDFNEFRELDKDKEGTYCIREIEILAYECDLWKRVLEDDNWDEFDENDYIFHSFGEPVF